MTAKRVPVGGEEEDLLQIIQREIVCRNIRKDREAMDDLIIDLMAGELTADGKNIAHLVELDQLGEIYMLCCC